MTSRFHLNRNLILGFVGIYILRLLIGQFMGIMPQDAYYYLYSEYLALSYFDHPPMVAYMLKLSSTLFGQSVTVIKLTDFTVSFLSFLSFYYLSTFFLSKRKAAYAAILYGSTLQLTVLSVNTTPDVPLLFFWTISLIVLYKTVTQNKLYLWMLSGVLIGLSFNSKYTGLFLLLGLFLFLIMSKNHRHLLFSRQIFVTLFFILLTVSPIIYWNIKNDWISFAFQTTERASDIARLSLQPKYFLGTIGTQMVLLVPFFFCGMIFVLYKLSRKMIKKRAFLGENTNFLLAFSLPVIAFFFSVSLFYWVKLNWLMPGYITASILASIYLSRKLLVYQVVSSLIFHVLFFIQVAFYLIPINSDDTWLGWEQLAEKVEVVMKEHPESFVFSSDGYKTSAVLNFYMDEHVYSGNILGDNGLQFSIIDSELDHLATKDAIYIDSETNFKNLSKSNHIPERLSSYFSQVTELEPIIIEDSKQSPVRKFLVYRCIGYTHKVDNTTK